MDYFKNKEKISNIIDNYEFKQFKTYNCKC